MQYAISRIRRALGSPAKLREYLSIILRMPYLFSYYTLYDLRHQESRQARAERARTEARYHDETNPLISIVIPTYNRADILRDRPLASIAAQTYPNFEVLVVGDGCTDHTAEAVASFNDSRFRFVNLQERGQYPDEPKLRWFVAGTPPVNYGNQHAGGLWMAHLDDDEIFEPEHLEKLLRFAQQGDYEFVYSQVNQEMAPGEWEVVGKQPIIKYLHMNHCGHSTTLWRRYLNHYSYDLHSWRIRVPGDQNRWARLQLTGVRIGFLPEVTTIAPLRPGVTLFGHRSEDR
jgi:glycosyltransferase involved in cell wall biosynthesis